MGVDDTVWAAVGGFGLVMLVFWEEASAVLRRLVAYPLLVLVGLAWGIGELFHHRPRRMPKRTWAELVEEDRRACAVSDEHAEEIWRPIVRACPEAATMLIRHHGGRRG